MTLEELWQLFPIELSGHDPAWAGWYEDEKAALLEALGDAVARIDHIGSTAVAGIQAKPIVDILLQVAPSSDAEEVRRLLAESGWLMMSEQAEPDARSDWNKGYTPDGFAEKVYHLHVRPVGDWDELHFRDFIKACAMRARAEQEAAGKENRGHG